MTAAARDIYQAHLDHVSHALWERDWPEAVRYWSYPHVMRTSEHVGVVESEEEMVLHSQTFRERMAGLGATAYHRVCISAEFDADDPDRIVGRHRTYILRGGNYVVPPYDNEMILGRGPDFWVSSFIAVSIGMSDQDPTTRALTLRHGLGQHMAIPSDATTEDRS